MHLWKGAAQRASESDIRAVAADYGLRFAHIRAFMEVEAPRGSFDDEGRPTILWERHYFWRLLGDTPARETARAAGLASPQRGGYGRYAAQYGKLERAYDLAPRKALMSASWGAGQIMGANFESAGFDAVEDMVVAFAGSEVEQIRSICSFLKRNGLLDDMIAGRWHVVARGYNGAAYAEHNYHGRLAAAFARFDARDHAEGDAQSLQAQLKRAGFARTSIVEGVKAFQAAHDLATDGIAGPITRRALAAAVAAA